MNLNRNSDNLAKENVSSMHLKTIYALNILLLCKLNTVLWYYIQALATSCIASKIWKCCAKNYGGRLAVIYIYCRI